MIFEEFAQGDVEIFPDDALNLMEELFREAILARPDIELGKLQKTAIPRFDFSSFRREAHHFAVDKYYATYYFRGKGAPRLFDAQLDRVLQLQKQGLGYGRIAKIQGQSKDTTAKQAKKAHNVWNELRDRLYRRFPQFVATKP